MRHILSVFIIFFSVCVITGCDSPVGNISDGGGNGYGRGQYDFLMLRPKRFLYELDSGADGRFDRVADLSVFVADDDGYRMINILDPNLTLEIIMNPGFAGETTVVINTLFTFSEPGRHIIRGTYGNKTDEYSIEVRGTFVNPGDGSGFIGIEWQ